jgi:molybdate transport system substrate-binding protein
MQRRFSKRQLAAVLMLLALTCLGGCRNAAQNDELFVFAAASTSDALNEVAHEFESETKQKVQFSFGGSKDLARQIRAGAPVQVFVSADSETMDGLIADRLVRSEDRRAFLSNRLVIVTPRDSTLAIRTAADLAQVPHVAMGDPKLVPAGNYAKLWLEKERLWTDVTARIVPALDVRAALAAVETGNAEAGIVYRTDAAHSPKVQIAYEVPADKMPTISYVAARLTRAENPAGARFVDFLVSEKARAIFARHGFVL